MPITTKMSIEKREGGSFKPLPEDVYQVELLDITEEERPTYDTRNKPDAEKKYEKVFNFQFTLLEGSDEGESLRGRNIWANFIPAYLFEGSKGKNKLYKIVEALVGRQLTQEDEAKMDSDYLNALIGTQCRLGVKNKASGDKVFSNIETYYPKKEQLPKLTDEEKEKARIKKDKEGTKEEDEITADDIGF